MADLEWYRSFLAIYRAGTVSAAARALFLTQPAVTQHLAALESFVGEPLFMRAPRQMIPTLRGKQLYSQVVQALETLELVTEEIQNAHVELPLLRCGAPREYFVDIVLKRFIQLPYRLLLRFAETAALIADLEREQLDVVIATQQIASREVEYHRIDEECFQIVGPPDLLLFAAEATLGEAEELEAIEQWLAAQRWISYGVELPIIRRFWQQCFGKRPSFQAALIVPDLHAIQRIIEEGGGISILPDYLCREGIEAGRLQVLWEPLQKVSNELWLAYRKVERNEAKIKALRQLWPRL
ncbi:LysR family transcriptional regulator [Ktedonosporobacter rubrisoli]|uniref:LysR family transcriptional regulator n=1 Tax=Ktedonosporobacter rubrisoli TaxID=2509675 RepID=A0A4P6JZU0_KTERU|nr:LysR family transcriptional regulator [Ktedonosporobacter rubrisoli]QBD81033.1 LysR family transcriptional regulator [Ktedonosporobacter rubrisoli]